MNCLQVSSMHANGGRGTCSGFQARCSVLRMVAVVAATGLTKNVCWRPMPWPAAYFEGKVNKFNIKICHWSTQTRTTCRSVFLSAFLCPNNSQQYNKMFLLPWLLLFGWMHRFLWPLEDFSHLNENKYKL